MKQRRIRRLNLALVSRLTVTSIVLTLAISGGLLGWGDLLGGWQDVRDTLMFAGPAVGLGVLSILYVWIFDRPTRSPGGVQGR
jgi:hypothetical protein